MLADKRLYWASQTALLLIAGLIGAIISEWVSTSSMSVVSMVALVGITAAALGVLYFQQVSKEITDKIGKVEAIGPVVESLPQDVSDTIVQALASRHDDILTQLDKLSDQVKFDALYVRPADISLQYNPVYDRLRAAETEILVLDQFFSENRPDLNLGDDTLTRSLNALLDLPSSARRRGRYERVIQTTDGSVDKIVKGASNVFIEHFRQVLEAENPRALLHVAPWCYSSKFTVIDGEVVILQIHHRNEVTGHHDVEGELILCDPTGKLGELFRVMFEAARSRSTPIRLRDMPWMSEGDVPQDT